MNFNEIRKQVSTWILTNYADKRWSKKAEDALSIEDLWLLASKRVPPVVFEYFRGGADNEITLRENSIAWQECRTTARGAKRFESVNTKTNFSGIELEVPWTIAPVGSLALLYPKADRVAAKVAKKHGTLMTLSTLSGTPMEEVSNCCEDKSAFQLYLCGGRDASIKRIERAKKAGFKILMLTIDTGVCGHRNGHARMKPVQAMSTHIGNIKTAPQVITRPSWLSSHYAGGGMIKFVNVELENGEVMPYTDISSQLTTSAVTWEDFNWIKKAWNSKIVVKGVHCAEDAKKAESLGADGVVWSNHGGRQQDRVLSTYQIMAEEMPKMKGSKMSFMVDGGIRDGNAVFTALTHGVDAVGLGRSVIAGIGSGGFRGLDRAFEIFKLQFTDAMKLIGVSSIQEIKDNGPELRRQSMFKGDSKFIF